MRREGEQAAEGSAGERQNRRLHDEGEQDGSAREAERSQRADLDTLYLAPARSRLFAALPEVEIPRGFDSGAARRWLAKIPPSPRRLAVERRLEALLSRR